MATLSSPQLDNYIRSVAAQRAEKRVGEVRQFIGKVKLQELVAADLPDSKYGFKRIEILQRLAMMINLEGFAMELDRRVREQTLWQLTRPRMQLPRPSHSSASSGSSNSPPDGGCEAITPKRLQQLIQAANTPSPAPAPAPAPAPVPLSPVYNWQPLPSSTTLNLPYRLQHRILPPLQCLLERLCHSFLSMHDPAVIATRCWPVPEAAELTAYTREIPALAPCTPLLAEIRHKAVHRNPVSIAKLESLLEAAEEAARIMNGSREVWQIVRVRRRVKEWQQAAVTVRAEAEERVKALEREIREVWKSGEEKVGELWVDEEGWFEEEEEEDDEEGEDEGEDEDEEDEEGEEDDDEFEVLQPHQWEIDARFRPIEHITPMAKMARMFGSGQWGYTEYHESLNR